MGRPAGWMTTLTGRPAMRSPGRPPIRRDVERAFWAKIAEGLTSEDAAVSCGVSPVVGSRWFRERGGMPSIQLSPPSGGDRAAGGRPHPPAVPSPWDSARWTRTRNRWCCGWRFASRSVDAAWRCAASPPAESPICPSPVASILVRAPGDISRVHRRTRGRRWPLTTATTTCGVGGPSAPYPRLRGPSRQLRTGVPRTRVTPCPKP